MGLDSGRRIGAYEIVGPLGSGGMGDVYRARDTRLGRPVAIKLVSAEVGADQTAHDRLEREARLTSSLNHPNIVTVYDVGEVDGQPFIVMELVSGETLHARMASRRMKIKEVVDIAAQVAEGLAAAHGAGVVHRDLKPRNVMLTPDGRAKIVDFGLGKATPIPSGPNESTAEAGGLTGAHAIVGTAGYMSPEQVTSHPVDFRSDQFALGSIVYEMLTGRRAFKRETPVQTMAAVADSEPPPLAESCPDAPQELVTVVNRCLSKDPTGRYASTEDLARDLRDVRASMSSTHSSGSVRRPPSRSYAGWLVAVVALTGAALIALAIFQPRSSQLEEARALLARYDKAENVNRAVELLRAEAAALPADPKVRISLAEAYWRQAEPTKDAPLIDRAGAEAATALRLDEGSASVHIVLAMINNGQGRWNGGLSEAERAVELERSNGLAHRELGRALLGLGRRDEAREAFLEAVALAPDDWSTHINLGAFYMATGQLTDAISAFEKVLSLTPDNAKAYNNLGVAYRALERYDDAAAMLERSATINPSASAFSNIGVLHYDRGLYAEAARAFERATAQPDATSRHWRNLGSAAYWAAGQRDRALEAFREAVRLGRQELAVNPKDQNLLAELASACAVLGDHAEARDLLATLEHLQPQGPQVLFTIASAFEGMGDRQSALTWLGRAIEAGYSLDNIERSPWLVELRKDEAYAHRFE